MRQPDARIGMRAEIALLQRLMGVNGKRVRERLDIPKKRDTREPGRTQREAWVDRFGVVQVVPPVDREADV